jgi:hypothetical protein
MHNQWFSEARISCRDARRGGLRPSRRGVKTKCHSPFRSACALSLLLTGANPAAADHRATLLPQLRAGATLTYQIRLRIDKRTHSESRIAIPTLPGSGPADILRTIRVDVLDVAPGNPRAKLVLRVQIQDPAATSPVPVAKALEFAIRSDGTVVPPKEVADLSAEDADAWQAWLARFAIAWTIPGNGVKVGDNWSAEESIAGTPLAGLYWQKESQYVRDERCPAPQAAAEPCAILFTTSILKQRSSSKDATPDDFKLRQLKTMGTAKGRNEMFTYISRVTGLVVRSSEEASQFMDVVIAKSDGSNRVHFNVDAKSSSEMRLVQPSP